MALPNPVVKQYYQDEAVARYYDAERFSSLAGRTLDALEKRAIRKLIRRVRQEIPSPSVLDVPCGTGRITELFLQQGLKVTGGDISLPMLEVARNKLAAFEQVTFAKLDLDHLEVPDNTFDLVACIRLLHHFESARREQVLQELARVSRRFVMINVSFSSSYYAFRRRVKRWLNQGISKCSSTWEEICREAKASGLQVRGYQFVARFLSEDLVLLLQKESTQP